MTVMKRACLLLFLPIIFLIGGCQEQKPTVVRSKPPKIISSVVFRPTFQMSDNPDIKGFVGFVGALEKGENYFFTPLHSFGPKNGVFTQLSPRTVTRVLEKATLYSMDNKTRQSTAGKSILNVGRPTSTEGNCAYDVIALQMPPSAPSLPLAHSDARPDTQVWLYGTHLHSAIVRSVEAEALTVVLEKEKTERTEKPKQAISPISLKKMNGTPLVNKYGEVIGMLNTYVDDGEETVLLVTPVSAIRLLFEANKEATKEIGSAANPFDTSL